jgi:hypothetical protein
MLNDLENKQTIQILAQNTDAMRKIKFLKIQFDTQIEAYELPAFRGAIIAKVGREHDWFHNHLDDARFVYRYSLIQYKRVGKNPTILCIDEGVEEIHKFFEKSNWDISIGERNLEMKIAKLDMNQFRMQVWDKPFGYHIQNYLALNQKNFAEYQTLRGLGEKIAFLERKLIAHIIVLAKGIEWDIDKTIELKITQMAEPRPVRYKDQTLLGFNFDFETNVFLPNYIGLGGKVSVGFGVVKMLKL